jgi:hypothetical protein
MVGVLRMAAVIWMVGIMLNKNNNLTKYKKNYGM